MLNIICSEQHGFCKNRSCETQLLETVQNLTLSLNAATQTDLFLLDFFMVRTSLLMLRDVIKARNGLTKFLWNASFITVLLF